MTSTAEFLNGVLHWYNSADLFIFELWRQLRNRSPGAGLTKSIPARTTSDMKLSIVVSWKMLPKSLVWPALVVDLADLD